MSYESVPEELKALPNWVGWKLEIRDGEDRPTKVPYASTHEKASSTSPLTWRAFTDVCEIPPSQEKGIGFVFDGKGIVGIDLDDCLFDNAIDPKFENIIKTLNSYTEVSPSGSGVHIFIRCNEEPYPTGKKKGNVEIYSKQRYFTVTGNVWLDQPINTVSAETVRALMDPLVNPKRMEETITRPQTSSPDLSDDDIIRIASGASNSHKFERLMDGHIGDYANDRSVADMALASILAFYTTDPNQIERIMRMSGLVREKWDKHQKYLREYTIAKAIQMCNHHFEPKYEVGDVKQGKESADAIMSKKLVSTEKDENLNPSELDLNEDSNGRKKLAESAEIIKLPPFPGTKHDIFGGWMNVASQISYSRTPFHYFALMGLCTMILGKRVRVVLSGKTMYSNMFIQILGTSSVSGKSFALDMTTDDGRFLSAIQKKISIPKTGTGADLPPQTNQICKFMVQTNKITEPRMIQDLAKVNDNMLWYFDEAQTFYAGAANNNSSILPQLCLIYDGKTVKSKLSISKKKDNDNQDYEWVCEKPFGTLMFAMTDDQFDKLASSEQSEGGFLPRFMFIYEQGGEVKENVDITHEQQLKIDELVNDVQYIAEKLCILNNDTISFKVCPRIEKWKVEETNKHLGVEHTDRRIAIQRIFIQVYKIAMVLSIMDKKFVNDITKNKKINGHVDPITLDLPEEWVEEALNIAERYLLPRMIHILQKANDVNAKSNMSKIMKVIRSQGGSLERQKVGKFTHIEKKMLDESLDSLVENNELNKVRTLENGHWITRYCLC